MFGLASGNPRDPLDFGVGENVIFVGAAGGKFTDDGSIGPGLEPVEGVGLDGKLLAGIEGDFVPDGEGLFPVFRGGASWLGGGLAFHVEKNFPPAATERFLLAGVFANRRMAVFGTGLAGPHGEFLGAATVGVHIDQHSETDFLKPSEAEIGGFDCHCFGGSDEKACFVKIFLRLAAQQRCFVFLEHGWFVRWLDL